MCSLFGRKMWNREVLKISECLRTLPDQTPLTQLLYAEIFLWSCMGFLDTSLLVGTGGNVPFALLSCVAV